MPESGKEGTLIPPVLWAQRKDSLYLLINVVDCVSPIIGVEKDKLQFRTKGGSDGKNYEITLDFLKDIKPETSRHAIRGRGAEFVLMKTGESAGYWERLLKDKAKHHWLKVDFNKWRDEDDSENEYGEEADFEEVMKGMAGLSSSNTLDDLEVDSDEESDEDTPATTEAVAS